MSKKRVAVIGAGASGLTAIKCCLDEGLEPVCFERTDYIGGLWHYTDYVKEGQGCVTKWTDLATSKEMMCYSDFPMPAEFPSFMHNTYVDKYMNMYADTFGLKRCIQLNTEVLSVKPLEASNGQWEITSQNTSSKTETQTFDAVMVCTGHHADKYIPTFPGLNTFQGKVTHSHGYKDYRGYEDKRVLIIGVGNSGGDLATELSRISKQIYLSTRSGAWIINRMADDGNPYDMLNSSRYKLMMAKLFPNRAAKLAAKSLDHNFNHARFCLQPEFAPTSVSLLINDELPSKIISGGVIVKANVREFTETGAIFEDGTKVDKLDIVILATGYVFGFPFLDKSVTEANGNQVNLYKYVFPPDLTNHTLAMIGCVQPRGAIPPVSEMQSRWAARVFQGKVLLPTREGMWNDIKIKHDKLARRYKTSLRHTMQVDFLPYLDEVAQLIGCKPDFKKLFLTDPKLAVECFFGPGTPYQFRLMGPGPWSGARDAIFTQWERTYAPLKTRPCRAVTETIGFGKVYIVIVIVVVFVVNLLMK